MTTTDAGTEPVTVDSAVVRFAGDSGDGMQLTGDRFTAEQAVAGNDLSTFPDFPAEIRAPAGTLAGVSAFQLHFSDHDIYTPGDAPDVLVAMNAAAFKKNLPDVRTGGVIIVNTDGFGRSNLKKAGYGTDNPLDDASLDEDYKIIRVPITELTLNAVGDMIESGAMNKKEAERAKNFFALGVVSWMFSRDTSETKKWLEEKFGDRPAVYEANVRSLKAGETFAIATQVAEPRRIAPATLPPGTYRNITGNQALAYGLVAAGVQSGLDVFLGSYPITPASDILHQLARMKHFGVTTFQAEDEIAAVGSAIGAAFGGALAVTTSSGPGIALKGEAIGLAMMIELPLIVVNVQRGGPSTGLPTKSEQSDLFQAMYGRNGESPIPVIAPSTPSGCFHAAIEAARIAVTYRTPVMLLTDGFLANSAEPWLLPDVADLPEIHPNITTEPDGTNTNEDGQFLGYARDAATLARPWALPGTKGLEHRVGGLEKFGQSTGNISYDGGNHDDMTRLRHERVRVIADSLPPLVVDGDQDAELLVVGWGSTEGPIRASVERVRAGGRKVARIHLHHLAPFPNDLEGILKRHRRVLLPENNAGQLRALLRAEYLVDVRGHNKVTGLPFRTDELQGVIEDHLDAIDADRKVQP